MLNCLLTLTLNFLLLIGKNWIKIFLKVLRLNHGSVTASFKNWEEGGHNK